MAAEILLITEALNTSTEWGIEVTKEFTVTFLIY